MSPGLGAMTTTQLAIDQKEEYAFTRRGGPTCSHVGVLPKSLKCLPDVQEPVRKDTRLQASLILRGSCSWVSSSAENGASILLPMSGLEGILRPPRTTSLFHRRATEAQKSQPTQGHPATWR